MHVQAIPKCHFQPDISVLITLVWHYGRHSTIQEQESPAIADKPARRESLPKIGPIRRAYNVVAENTGLSSFV